MRRLLLISLAFIAIILLGGDTLYAQARWEYPPFSDADWRGPGFYLSWWKMLACWLVFLGWVVTTDWANRDMQRVRSLNHLIWNPILFGVFFGAFVLSWVLPMFWVALPILLIAHLVPLLVFIVMRNSVVESHQRVLTPDHLWFLVATGLNRIGVKVAVEKTDPHEKGPPVRLRAHGGPTEQEEGARLGLARQSRGFRAAREIIAGGLLCRASSIMLDFTQNNVAVRYMVDGLWLPREPEPREKADPALETLKILCGLNPEDRQSRQEGAFAMEYVGRRLLGTVASQGTNSGERVVVQFEERETKYNSLEELGMRDKMAEQLREVLGQPNGFFVISALPASGLRTTTHLTLRALDRFMRDFVGIEEASNRYEAIENIGIETYNTEETASPASIIPRILRKEPNAVVVRDLPDSETATMLVEAATNRLVITTIRAKDCAEALLRVAAIGVQPKDLAKNGSGVLCQRLVRKLCDKCKEAYQPSAEVLQQLGIPEGRIAAFYRPPSQPPDRPCLECGGIGYAGRTAVFELLIVGNNVRKVLAGAPKLDVLRSAARKDGMRTMQEEGLLLVAKGVTSLQELMRVMKQ
ncbi:MAG: ATPase, T2SS/T4P/T4SS family [Planctomycetota bacterium]